jgi:hypothetical protein
VEKRGRVKANINADKIRMCKSKYKNFLSFLHKEERAFLLNIFSQIKTLGTI